MKTTLMCLVAVAVITLLAPSVITFANGNAQAPPVAGEGANSVRITVGGETVANVAEGDVVYEGEKVSDDGAGKDGELPLCDIPGVRMQFSGDVSRVRVGLAKGTCNLIVKDLVMNYTLVPTPDDNTPASTAINAQLGYEWHIESLGKVAGINSIDDLTKTYARFNFKTQYITGGGPLFDGSTAGGQCWGHYDWPLYRYIPTSCLYITDIAGPQDMHVEYAGEYEHEVYSTFDHEVTSWAIAKAYVNMGDVFAQDCSENGVAYSWAKALSANCTGNWSATTNR